LMQRVSSSTFERVSRTYHYHRISTIALYSVRRYSLPPSNSSNIHFKLIENKKMKLYKDKKMSHHFKGASTTLPMILMAFCSPTLTQFQPVSASSDRLRVQTPTACCFISTLASHKRNEDNSFTSSQTCIGNPIFRQETTLYPFNFGRSMRAFHCQTQSLSMNKKSAIDDVHTNGSTSNKSDSSDSNYNNQDTNYLSYATTYHAPVMARECIEAMLKISTPTQSSKKKKKYEKYKSKQMEESSTPSTKGLNEIRSPLILVDGTLGGGGHSKALLEKMKPGDILIGCDVDPDALTTASERLKDYLVGPDSSNSVDTTPNHPIFIPVQSNFRNLHKVIPNLDHPLIPNTPLFATSDDEDEETSVNTNVDGILLDLGVSSFQIDNARRGFAFLKDGPLDMRMNSNNGGSRSGSLTAADICNEFNEHDLIRILRRYGDEPRARAIAGAIIENRPLSTTADLRSAVAQVTPEFAKKGRRMGRKATLARVFQALRIVVNEEDMALKEALEKMTSSLVTKVGGRLVVLSYHSMEDGMVKRVMRDGTVEKQRGVRHEEKDLYGNIIGKGKPWKMLGKGYKASEEEVKMNSRARSATLRIGERM